jgi:hypothetical protein
MTEPNDKTSLTDHLAPLKWHGPMEASGMTSWFASTQFGQYMVKQLNGRTNWSYSFQNGGRATECESIDVGKAAAWQHWCENIQRCFTPHPMDHTLIQWPKDKTDTTG